jgi:DNA-binding SARP family transcriptional activator
MSERRSLLRPARSRNDPPGVPVESETQVQLRLLSAFELWSRGGRLRLPLSAQRVVAFVALHEEPVLRARVAGSLWLDSPEDRAGANLRSALWRVRRVEPSLVDASQRELRLGRAVRVDLREAETVARAALREDVGEDVDVDSLTSDLLPGWYEDWVLFERERFRQLRLCALDTLSERLTRAGRIDEALEAGLLSVAGEPLRESAHRAVIQAHLADGNTVEAVREYCLFRRLLREQLGIGPSGRMQELVAGLDDQEPKR